MTSLEILLQNKRLKQHETSEQELENLFLLVRRDMSDASSEAISLDNRLSILFNAALTLCRIGLYLRGYRPAQGGGFKEITVRSLELTMGEKWRDTMEIIDATRVSRNRVDYESIGAATREGLAELISEIEDLYPAILAEARQLGFELKGLPDH